MPRSIIEYRHKKKSILKLLKNYFIRPINTVPLIILIVGIALLYVSFGQHPVVSQPISQNSTYAVNQNVTTFSAFTIFENRPTYVTFDIPSGDSVNYSLTSLIELQILPTLNNPGGVKVVTNVIASGIASPNTTLVIDSQNSGTALATYFTLQSVSGSRFNMTITSVAYYNTTLRFAPDYALTGMGLTVGSATVLASVAGVKREEN